MNGELFYPHFRTVLRVLSVVGISKNLQELYERLLDEETNLMEEYRIKKHVGESSAPFIY